MGYRSVCLPFSFLSTKLIKDTKLRAVSFLPTSGLKGWTLDYTSLTLHALTPATGGAGGEGAHLYCQVDESDRPGGFDNGQTNGNGVGNGHADGRMGNGEEDEDEDEEEGEEEEHGEDEYTPMREIRIFVDEGKRMCCFSALCWIKLIYSRSCLIHFPPVE
jgi:hypothetical protein